MLAELEIQGKDAEYRAKLKANNIPKMLRLLEHMVKQEAQYLRHHPEIGHPYEEGIEYQTEDIDPLTGKPLEEWQRIKTTRRLRWKRGKWRRWGDCEDLCIWLAAWYRARCRIRAKVAVLEFRRKGKIWYHAVVLLPDGVVLDPSRVLGMEG